MSLAPRFVGRFEKGVDYIGDLAAFETDFAAHAAIARQLRALQAQPALGLRQVQRLPDRRAARRAAWSTSRRPAPATSRPCARWRRSTPRLFREIYAFARERYETDKASYHVSAELATGAPSRGREGRRPAAPARAASTPGEILHVTFGSVLKETNPDGSSRFKDRLMTLLRSNPDAYADNLEKHFVRHLQPFAR